MRTIIRLRFKSEPTGLRGVVNSGILNPGGPKKWEMQLDESTGLVYLRTSDWERAIHVSDCAWIEFAPAAPAKEPAPKK